MAKVIVHETIKRENCPTEAELLAAVSDPAFQEQLSPQRSALSGSTLRLLAPLRRNLLNWIDLPRDGSFLELGAGYGDVTMALAAVPGSRVVSVEGSPTRAEIIAKRCRAFDKVEVHTCLPASFDTDGRFDVVLLLGGLETAGRDLPGEPKPFHALLSRAKGLLNEKGTLVIAVDNRLGHRYLAGLPDALYGEPFEGINNYPRYNGARAFDYEELKALCAACGLSAVEFFFPCPDAASPELILAERAFTLPSFDPLALLDLPSQDPASKRTPLFSEIELLKSLRGQGCAHRFMNSFLVFASAAPSRSVPVDPNLLAVRLQSLRAAPFATRLSFLSKESGTVVEKRRIDRGSHGGPHEEQFLIHNPAAGERTYRPGLYLA